MSDEHETKFCGNCKRNVPESNYTMHSVYCERKIRLCGTCQEPVPIDEAEKHEEEFHSVEAYAPCPDCSLEILPADLAAHRTESCKKRMVTCRYCHIDLKAEAIESHENFCGSRSHICEGCGQRILVKYLKLHEETMHEFTGEEPTAVAEARDVSETWENRDFRNSSADNADVKIPCEFCQKPISANILLSHQRVCQLNSCPKRFESACPHCGTSNPTSLHVTTCQRESSWVRHDASLPSTSSALPSPGNGTHPPVYSSNSVRSAECFIQDAVEIPCEFCHELYPVELINFHQNVCDARRGS